MEKNEKQVLTIEMLDDPKNKGKVILTGLARNEPGGLYMTSSNLSRELLWIVKVGWVGDWAMYCHWSNHDIDFIKEEGDKVATRENVSRMIEISDEVWKRYRF